MKRILYTMMVMLMSVAGFSQTDSTWHDEFRGLAQIGQTEIIQKIFTVADSLNETNSKKLLVRMDSLAHDSLYGDRITRICSEMEKYFWFKSKENDGQALASLRSASAEMEALHSSQPNSWSAVYPIVMRHMISDFKNLNDLPSALRSAENLLKDKEFDILQMQRRMKASIDSMHTEINDLDGEYSIHMETLHEEKFLWSFAAKVLSFLAILFLLIIFIQRSRLLSKVKAANQKKADTSELDALVVKVNNLQAENQQFKTTAQQAIQHLNTMDASHRKLHAEVRQLGDELGAALAEMRVQSEQVKTKVDPPTYMGLQNVVTRLGSAVQQRMSAINELLVK